MSGLPIHRQCNIPLQTTCLRSHLQRWIELNFLSCQLLQLTSRNSRPGQSGLIIYRQCGRAATEIKSSGFSESCDYLPQLLAEQQRVSHKYLRTSTPTALESCIKVNVQISCQSTSRETYKEIPAKKCRRKAAGCGVTFASLSTEVRTTFDLFLSQQKSWWGRVRCFLLPRLSFKWGDPATSFPVYIGQVRLEYIYMFQLPPPPLLPLPTRLTHT